MQTLNITLQLGNAKKLKMKILVKRREPGKKHKKKLNKEVSKAQMMMRGKRMIKFQMRKKKKLMIQITSQKVEEGQHQRKGL